MELKIYLAKEIQKRTLDFVGFIDNVYLSDHAFLTSLLGAIRK